MGRARETERPAIDIDPVPVAASYSEMDAALDAQVSFQDSGTDPRGRFPEPDELAPYGVDPQPEPQTFPMDAAPRDKRWIEASRDGKEWFRVRFYETRTCVGGRTWMPVKCWTTSDPPKAAHRVEGLTVWRECSQW